MKKTLYEILEVPPDASAEAIRESYQRVLAQHESGKKPGDEDAENRLKFIKHAYAVLADPNQRMMYDSSLKKPALAAGTDYADPFPRSDPGWRRWVVGGTIAVVLLVAGSTVVSYMRWKPAPKTPVAPAAPPAPNVVVVLPGSGGSGDRQQAGRENPGDAGSTPAQTELRTQVAVAVQAEPARAPQVALSAERIFERHSQSIAVILGFDGEKQVIQGSGVVVQPQRVITNCHVVRDAETVKVWQAARTYDARLEFGDTDPTRDLCQLFVPGLEAPAVPLGDSRKLKVGKRVFALGAPLGLALTLSEGIVSGLRVHQDSAYVQVTAPISPGSSGGALFDETGELVGITTFGALIGQNVNFAIPVEWIKDLPNRPRTPFPPRSPGDPRAR